MGWQGLGVRESWGGILGSKGLLKTESHVRNVKWWGLGSWGILNMLLLLLHSHHVG